MAYRLAPGAYVVALVAAMALARPAVGAELRLMNADNVTAASPCIGDPITPLCAAETAAACAIAGHKPYCDAVGRKFDPTFDGLRIGYMPLWQNRYEYLGEKALRAEDIPDWARSRGNESWKPGDVALRLWWQGCPPDDECFKAVRANPDRTVRKQCLTFAKCGARLCPKPISCGATATDGCSSTPTTTTSSPARFGTGSETAPVWRTDPANLSMLQQLAQQRRKLHRGRLNSGRRPGLRLGCNSAYPAVGPICRHRGHLVFLAAGG